MITVWFIGMNWQQIWTYKPSRLGPVPVAVVHVWAPAQAGVRLRWWVSPVVIISHYRAIVVVSGHCGGGVVSSSNLPVRTVQCGAVVCRHTRHWQAPVNGHGVGRQDCAWDWFLHLRENKMGAIYHNMFIIKHSQKGESVLNSPIQLNSATTFSSVSCFLFCFHLG